MRPIAFGIAFVLALLWTGCDLVLGTGENEETEIPDIDEVVLTVSTGIDTYQRISAHRGSDGSFEARGELLLTPGTHDIDLDAYEDDESVTDYLRIGPDYAELRYELDEELESKITVVDGDPNLTPLNTLLTSESRPRAQPKRSLEPQPGLYLCVKDTSEAHGTLRLVMERYEDYSSHEEQEPLRIDFDATFSLRTVPGLEANEYTPCEERTW